MYKIVGLIIWLIIGITCIYMGAYIRFLFFNKHKKSYKSISNDYYYVNYVIGLFIFICFFMIYKFILK